MQQKKNHRYFYRGVSIIPPARRPESMAARRERRGFPREARQIHKF